MPHRRRLLLHEMPLSGSPLETSSFLLQTTGGENLCNLECHNTREICSMRCHLLILHFFIPPFNKGKKPSSASWMLHTGKRFAAMKSPLSCSPFKSSISPSHNKKKPHVELTPQPIMHYCAVMADMINALYGIIIAWFTLLCLQDFLEDAGLRE